MRTRHCIALGLLLLAAAPLLAQSPAEPSPAAPAASPSATAAEAVVLNHALQQCQGPHRLALLEELSHCGIQAVPGLSRACLDPEESLSRSAKAALAKLGLEVREGGIYRGPKSSRKLALVFTGHGYAEGAETILTQLERHHSQASFFLTGDFYRTKAFQPLVERMFSAGHYVGPHSDKHLLYCSWESPKKLLVERGTFLLDLQHNQAAIQKVWRHHAGSQAPAPPINFFLPAFEHYSQEIADWSQELGLTLVNFTPGTRCNADYTGEADKNFVSSRVIFESILAKERQDPNGLNGFILLLHIGSGPGRTDKFHARFGELLDTLAAKGYQFVRLDELLNTH